MVRGLVYSARFQAGADAASSGSYLGNKVRQRTPGWGGRGEPGVSLLLAGLSFLSRAEDGKEDEMYATTTHGMDGWDWLWMGGMMYGWIILVVLAVFLAVRLANRPR